MEQCMLCGVVKRLLDGYMCSECHEDTMNLTTKELYQRLWNKVNTHDKISCGCNTGTEFRMMVAYNDGKARVIKLCKKCGRVYR